MNRDRPLAAPYPIEAFHALVGDACRDILQYSKAPDAICGMSLIGAMAMTLQAGFDVETPVGQRRPLSVNTMTIADSSDRKSAVDGLVLAPFHERQERFDAEYEVDMARYKSEIRAWKYHTADFKRRLAKEHIGMEGAEAYSRALEAHLTTEPKQPIHRRLLHEDLTPGALFEALSGDGESIAIVTDEGDVVFKSRAMANLGLLNRIYDGARSIPRNRVATGSKVIRNPRMSMSIMTQQEALTDYLDRRGDLARGSGHLARYLFGMPESTKGSRHIWFGYVPTFDGLAAFHGRVNEILDRQDRRRDAGCTDRELIQFSEDGKRAWVNFYNDVEEQLKPWGALRQIPDFASKAMEMVARLAAILHCFTAQEGKISVDTLQRAVALVNWHLIEFHRIFCPPPKIHQDVHKLLCYLQSNYLNYGVTSALRNELLRNGPVRPRENFEPALHQLLATGYARLRIEEKTKRRVVDLNPQAFASQSQL